MLVSQSVKSVIVYRSFSKSVNICLKRSFSQFFIYVSQSKAVLEVFSAIRQSIFKSVCQCVWQAVSGSQTVFISVAKLAVFPLNLEVLFEI